MTQRYRISPGSQFPLGATLDGQKVHFSIFSEHAKEVILFLFTPQASAPFFSTPLFSSEAGCWHVQIEGLSFPLEYAYQINGPVSSKKGVVFFPDRFLLDPYAKEVSSHAIWGQGKKYYPKGKISMHPPFDWQGVSKPQIAEEEWIIYEMHVRGFTKHTSSHVKHPGTFLGVIEKIPHLKSLGVNAVEFLPLFEFNECENTLKNPETGKPLYNFWGYSTVNFFSPMLRYATDPNLVLEECKTMVRELHRNGIAVILDVVYNHTAEGNEKGPILSFKGIDNAAYYLITPDGHYHNFSGTGNTLSCNHPVVMQLILDSLRYWTEEMQIDGFRFDLASILTRSRAGTPLQTPPLLKAMQKDPVLSKAKMIAEPWDAAGLYQVGSFPALWSEWNGQYRDIVRRFIKGTDGQVGDFAMALSGSENLYGHNRAPYHSINFITAHDGYTLKDLVSYQDKHNRENGEKNQDGNNNNESWNCGAEGESTSRKVSSLRKRQMKNFHTALFLSIGTPMMLMGDEYGHTRNGNNNPYCQDNERNWFLWDELQNSQELLSFCQNLIALRKKHKDLFCRETFLKPADVDWHGHSPLRADWSHSSRFLSYTLKDHKKGNHLYIAYNAHYEPAYIELPPLDSKRWHRVIDTSLNPPYDYRKEPQKSPALPAWYILSSYSAFVAEAHPSTIS